MFIAYKLVQWALLPELWIVATLLGAWALGRSEKRIALARRVLLGAILVLVVLATRPAGELLIGPLGNRATVLGTASLDRLVVGIEALEAGVAPVLVVVGGVGAPFGGVPPEGESMKQLAVRLGVAADSVLVESTSRCAPGGTSTTIC